MVRKIIYFVLLLLLSNVLNAQYETDYTFTKVHDYQIPDSLIHEDAVIINKITDISYRRYAKFYQRVYINTEKGAAKYSAIKEDFVKGKLDLITFDAQIIKPNGHIVSYNKSNVYEEEATFKTDHKKLYISTAKLPLTDLEVGDILEYVIELDGFYVENELFVNDKNFYTLEHNVVIQPYGTIRYTNTKQKPIKYQFMGIKTFRWKFHHLAPLERKFANNYEVMPYIQFGPSFFRTYNLHACPGTMSMQRFIDIATRDNHDDTPYNKFLKVFQRYLHETEIVDVEALEYIHSTEVSDLNRGYLKQSEQIGFFAKIMEMLELPIIQATGYNKYTGNTKLHPITFFIVRNQLGELQYIHPKSQNKSYFIGELPLSIKGSYVDVREKTRVDAMDKETYRLHIPESNPKKNHLKQKTLVDVDLKTRKANMSSKIYLSGDMSTILRHKYDKLSENYSDPNIKLDLRTEGLVIDSMYKTKQQTVYPFTASYQLDRSSETHISEINDTLISIDISDWLSHMMIKIEDRVRRENIFAKTRFTDLQDFYLKFDQEIELIEDQNHTIYIENEFGKYEFQVKQLNETNIQIHSLYKVYNNYYPKEKYKDVLDLVQTFEKAKQNTLIIKKN